MQHDITEDVLASFLNLVPGEPTPPLAGVRAVPLSQHTARFLDSTPSALMSMPEFDLAAQVEWRELSTPHPRRLLVDNPFDRDVVLDVGTRSEGGMSGRALSATTLVKRKSTVELDVQPVGARWWDQGQVRYTGRTHPLVTALLLQASVATGWFAASVQTLLTSWVALAVGQTEPVAPRTEALGCVLTGAHGVVAAWLLEPPAESNVTDVLPTNGPRASDGRDLHALSTLMEAVRRRMLKPHVAGEGPWGRDVVLLPPTPTLMGEVARVI